MVLIRGDNVYVTSALREFIDKKICKLKKYNDFSEDATTVVLNITKGIHKVEATVKCPSALIRAEESGDDMYGSVDLVIDKLDQQFRKYKKKSEHRLYQDGNWKRIYPSSNVEMESAATATLLKTDEEFEVVRTKRFKLKPMYTEEAILQMEMLGHNFFIFNMPDSDQIKIIYRRKDGKIGLIEPDAD